MRKVIYSSLCVIVVVMIVASCIHQYRISQFQKAKDNLELCLKKDGRFRDVRVIFYSTRPSAWVLAPEDLSLSSKQDLKHLVSDTFGSLPVPIRYAGPQLFKKANETSGSISNQLNLTNHP